MKLRIIKFLDRTCFLGAIFGVFGLMTIAVITREMLTASEQEVRASAQVTPVVVAEVREREFAEIISAVGTALANESVNITTKVSDVVSEILFDSGDYVEARQILVELDKREETAALSEAESSLEEATRERERTTELVAEGLLPSQKLDEAESNYQRAVARVNAIEARLADRSIRASFDGVLGLRNISVGELIQTGTVVATLNDVSMIKLDFEVPERFMAEIRSGQTIHGRTSAYPDEVFVGHVAHINNQVDQTSRTVTVRAEIPNADHRLVPGMLVGVDLWKDRRTAPAIPEAAAMRTSDQSYVFVVEGDGDKTVAKRRQITLGQRTGGAIEVLDGLSVGDRVVADGTHRTQDGLPVRIMGERSFTKDK